MVIFELTNTNFLLTLVILFTFQYGDIRIFLILVFSPIKGGFTFQSGDIQISFLYLLLKLISEFTFHPCVKYWIHIFFKFPINFFYSISTLKLDFSRACLSGLHILLGQLLPI